MLFRSIVISDVRFPNEIKAIHSAGGKVVRIKRGPEPSWYDDALNFNAGPQTIGWALGKHSLEKQNIHASEYSWVGGNIDLVIENNSTIDDLYQQIHKVLT